MLSRFIWVHLPATDPQFFVLFFKGHMAPELPSLCLVNLLNSFILWRLNLQNKM